MVSPLKPFEAMALEKAVVVSNTRALSEIVIHGTNGLHFEKGNIADLQQTLSKLVRDNVLRQTLGKAARTWVLEHRTWDTAGKVCTDNYSLALHTCTTCQPSAVLAASN
jgi:glycosyltransferase involved in cell wall biosynthesis